MATRSKFQDIPLDPIISTRDEDEWLVIETGHTEITVKEPPKPEKWLMVEGKAKEYHAKDALKAKKKTENIMKRSTIVNSSGIPFPHTDVKDTRTSMVDALETVDIELIPERGIHYYPDATATLQSAREGIEQYRERQLKIIKEFKAKSEMSQSKKNEKEKVPSMLKQRNPLLLRLRTQKTGAAQGSNSLNSPYPSPGIQDDYPEAWYRQPGSSSSQRFRLPEPDQVLKFIPVEGIAKSDLMKEFSYFWPSDRNFFFEWANRFMDLVRSVAIYDSETKFVKPKL